MLIRLEQRPAASPFWTTAAPFMAILATLIAGALLFAAMGFPPLPTLQAFFITPISSLDGLAELALKATPLALIAIGLAVGFRANVWNIGAEGQFVLGAITGGGMGLWLQEMSGASAFWVLPLMAIAGALGGMLWAAIPALLRTRFNASEILVSLMLVYVATLLLDYLVHGPWKDPMGFNFPQTKTFETAASLPTLIEGSRMHVGTLVMVIVVLAAQALMARGLIGFQVRVAGLAPAAAAYAGFKQSRMIWFCLLLSGALAGLAGMFEVAGPLSQLTPAVPQRYGFTAIIVAFLGRLSPVGILFAALVIALSYIGGESAQILLKLPIAVTGVFQGMLLFFLLGFDLLIRYRVRLSLPSARVA